jgi:hypothetical protein
LRGHGRDHPVVHLGITISQPRSHPSSELALSSGKFRTPVVTTDSNDLAECTKRRTRRRSMTRNASSRPPAQLTPLAMSEHAKISDDDGEQGQPASSSVRAQHPYFPKLLPRVARLLVPSVSYRCRAASASPSRAGRARRGAATPATHPPPRSQTSTSDRPGAFGTA